MPARFGIMSPAGGARALLLIEAARVSLELIKVMKEGFVVGTQPGDDAKMSPIEDPMFVGVLGHL